MWSQLKSYPEYAVSSSGQIMRIVGGQGTWAGRILKPIFDGPGYIAAKLCRNNVAITVDVHRLVATAFIPNPHNLPEVNHKDGIKANCSYDNLEWTTHQENIRHAVATGLKKRWGKGVSFYKRHGNWTAYACHLGKIVRLGYFPTEKEALKARKRFIKSITGDHNE